MNGMIEDDYDLPVIYVYLILNIILMANVIFIRKGVKNRAKNKEVVTAIDNLGRLMQNMMDNKEKMISKMEDTEPL